MDQFEQIIVEAVYAICVVGTGTRFELIDVVTRARLATVRARCDFIGVVGIVDGMPVVKLDVPLDEMTISALSKAFVERIENAIQAVERAMGDSAEGPQRESYLASA
jgi:hypothetical protein